MSGEREEPQALERHPGEQAPPCSLPRLSPPPQALGTEGDAHKKPSLPFTSKGRVIPWRGVGEEKEEALEANEQQDQTARGGDDAKNKTEHS